MEDNFEEIITPPVAPLGIIAMRGCEAISKKISDYIVAWRKDRTSHDVNSLFFTSYQREDYLINHSCPRFGSGEGKGCIKDTIRGYDLYIICDPFNYGVTYQMYDMTVPMSPDDHYQDLKRIIAATCGKARRITVIMPMLYEGRQHRRASRESLDCALALQELTQMGVDNIITFDAHDPRVQNANPLKGFENVQPVYQMIKALAKNVDNLQFDPKHMMIISPDEGAMSRCIYFSSVLGLDLGMFYKRRDYSTIVNGRNPIVAHEFLGDSVEGKDLIIVDDMISSGDSMLEIAYKLKAMKAKRIFACTTFGLFSDGLDKFDKAYQEGFLNRVFTTNGVYRRPELLERPWYVEVDISKYLAYFIDNLNHDSSISKLLSPSERIHNFLHRMGYSNF
ncbi:MAG TPA: ribose-phosphate pyrophosphokinase [Firmicutes bacterium]|nr:ribose-phosphate pyrophosphokinase [Bacillota bacterium]